MFNFDQSFFNIFYGVEIFKPAFYFASFLFDPIPFLIIVSSTYIIIRKFSKNKKDGFRFVLVISLSFILTWILKYLFMIDRPSVSSSISPSFPSAHSAMASSYFLFLLTIFKRDINVYRRKLHFAFCILSSIFVAVSRLYIGAHWLSDVLVGYLIGVAALFFVSRFYK